MHIPASDLHTYQLDQHEIESAPTITFRQFRRLAKRHEWSLEWLVEQCRDHIDDTTATIRRILEGAIVDGKRDRLEDTVITQWPLINLYLTRS